MLGFTLKCLCRVMEDLKMEETSFDIKFTILSCLLIYRPLYTWHPFRMLDMVSAICSCLYTERSMIVWRPDKKVKFRSQDLQPCFQRKENNVFIYGNIMATQSEKQNGPQQGDMLSSLLSSVQCCRCLCCYAHRRRDSHHLRVRLTPR